MQISLIRALRIALRNALIFKIGSNTGFLSTT